MEFSMALRDGANLLVGWVFGVWKPGLNTQHGIENPELMRQVGPGVWLTSSLGIESIIMAPLLLKWCMGTRAGNEYKSVQVLLIEVSLHPQIQQWSLYIPHICTKNGEIFVVSEFSMGWGLPQWGCTSTSFSFCRPSFPRRMLKQYCILNEMT